MRISYWSSDVCSSDLRGADNQHVADVADMGRETERRRAGSLGEAKRRPVQMLVPRRPGPDRRQRNQVREVHGVDERLADVGVDMAWQAAAPGLDRVPRLADGGDARSEQHTADLPYLMGT